MIKAQRNRKNISDIVFNIIPSNIFKALTEGNNLQILFFIIIFSIMLKFVPEEPCTNLFYSLESVYIAFEKAVDFSLYLLPFVLIALIAEQFNAIGVEILYALLKFILVIIGGVFIQFIIAQ
jgi:proton glutamate symport protein